MSEEDVQQLVPKEALVAKPGDTLIVSLPQVSQAEIERVKAEIEDELPQLQVLVLSGVHQIAAYRDTEGSG